jgi:two-component system cell cycle sensor histidine kinase/response regulator CckA
MTSNMMLDALRQELLDRLVQTEQRTEALETVLLRNTEITDTPRPARWLKRNPLPQQDVVLSAVVASLDVAIWSASPDGERLYVLTGGVEQTFGHAAQDVLERPGSLFETVPEPDRTALRDAFRRLSAAGTFQIEHAVRTADGGFRRIASRGKLIRAEDGQPLRVDGMSRELQPPEDGVAELASPLAATESQSAETARLEVVDRMLSGAAHDFNNLLGVITGHAELVREQLMPDDPLREPVELIASSGHLAARVARQLLSYARPVDADPETLDPNAALRDGEPMLRRFTGATVELDLLLTPDIAPIRIDRCDFDRIVLNLVHNARDAIEETGFITVRTAMAQVPAGRRGWPDQCPPGAYVALTVNDTGCGMTEEVKAQVFTRFFTTKGMKGTGLGLVTVRDLVQAAGGHIELESSPQWGTSVRVFWPAVVPDDEPIRLSLA